MNKIIITLFFAITTSLSFGQTLNEQFDSLKNTSESYKQYKVIERTRLDRFWNTNMDSVKSLKESIATLERENSSKAEEINTLNNSIEEKNTRIDELELQTSTIEVFGIDFNKSTFIFISFFTAGSLILIVLFLSYQFKDNNRLARQKVKEYEKLNDDFEEYKRNALEKQMKLRRDLQTERNKLDEARNM